MFIWADGIQTSVRLEDLLSAFNQLILLEGNLNEIQILLVYDHPSLDNLYQKIFFDSYLLESSLQSSTAKI